MLRIFPENFEDFPCFVSWGRPQKIHQNPPQLFNAKSPAKFKQELHKSLLESRQGNIAAKLLTQKTLYKLIFWRQISEESQEPEPPLLLKKVSQYTSNLYCNTPPICIAVLLVPLRSEEREILSVLLPFEWQYASHSYCNTPPICIAVLLGKSWWLWSLGCSPYFLSTIRREIISHIHTHVRTCVRTYILFWSISFHVIS